MSATHESPRSCQDGVARFLEFADARDQRRVKRPFRLGDDVLEALEDRLGRHPHGGRESGIGHGMTLLVIG